MKTQSSQYFLQDMDKEGKSDITVYSVYITGRCIPTSNDGKIFA
jgi:hypothetical protein